MRNRSGMLVAPERPMSSCEMTKTAAAVRDSVCSFFETDVTRIFNRSSRLACARLFPAPCCDCRGAAEDRHKIKSAGPLSLAHHLVITVPRARRKGSTQVKLKGYLHSTERTKETQPT